jgi:hypothetical protein
MAKLRTTLVRVLNRDALGSGYYCRHFTASTRYGCCPVCGEGSCILPRALGLIRNTHELAPDRQFENPHNDGDLEDAKYQEEHYSTLLFMVLAILGVYRAAASLASRMGKSRKSHIHFPNM